MESNEAPSQTEQTEGMCQKSATICPQKYYILSIGLANVERVIIYCFDNMGHNIPACPILML